MQEELTHYISLLHQYADLLQSLYQYLEPSLQTTGSVYRDIGFTLTERTIQQQVHHWPKELFVYPPVAWVQPRTGGFCFAGQEWTFAFHGAGLSFFQQASALDVSGEFTRGGTLALTAHTVWCYLSTHSTCAAAFATREALHNHYFEEVVERHIITPVTPLLDDDDQTYHLSSSHSAHKQLME